MKYYVVKFGHKEHESVSIGEADLPQAIKAQVTGKVLVTDGGTISGNAILAITPDYHRMMGWNRGYQLQAEDWAEIHRNEECEQALTLLTSAKAQLSTSQSELKRLN